MRFSPLRLISKTVQYVTKGPVPATKDVQLGSFTVGRNQPCFFIAEIGINHNGSVEIAKKLITAAAEAGAQAVKFQKRTVPIFYSKEELERSVPVDRAMLEFAIKRGVLPPENAARLQKSDFKDTTRGDYVWAREFTEPEYREIFAYAKGKGLLAFASPWDLESVDFLEKLNPPIYKVASATLTHNDLLDKVRSTGKPVILSTGMSTMEQINTAVNRLKPNPLVLLHTVSTYPAVESELNLKMISKLRYSFPEIPIGYSGHEKGTATSLVAVAYGAHVVERHITLDKNMFGTDQKTSLKPHEFAQLICDVNTMSTAIGDGVKRISPSEALILQHLRRK